MLSFILFRIKRQILTGQQATRTKKKIYKKRKIAQRKIEKREKLSEKSSNTTQWSIQVNLYLRLIILTVSVSVKLSPFFFSNLSVSVFFRRSLKILKFDSLNQNWFWLLFFSKFRFWNGHNWQTANKKRKIYWWQQHMSHSCHWN